jgi:hypothetical protein
MHAPLANEIPGEFAICRSKRPAFDEESGGA